MRSKAALALIALVALAALAPAARAAETRTSEKGLAYQIRVPRGYDSLDGGLLVLGLHGQGGSGERFMPVLEAAPFLADAVLVAPTATRGGAWEESDVDLLADLVREVRARHRTLRTVVFGFSRGAYMAFALGLRHPKAVQAVIPHSGGLVVPVPADEDAKRQAFYVIHGDTDPIVPVGQSRDAVRALVDGGLERVKYEEVKGLAHTIDPQASRRAFEWVAATLGPIAPAMSEAEAKEAIRAVEAAMKAKDHAAAAEALDALDGVPRAAVAKVAALAKAHAASADEGLARAACRAAARLGEPGLAALRVGIKSRSDPVAIEAARGLADVGGDAATAILIGALASVEGKDREPVEKEIHAALTRITGKTFASVREWRRWAAGRDGRAPPGALQQHVAITPTPRGGSPLIATLCCAPENPSEHVRPRRHSPPAMNAHHLVANANRPTPLVRCDAGRFDLVATVREHPGDALLSYCVMSTHYHAAAEGDRDDVVRKLDSAFQAYPGIYRARHGGRGSLFEGPLFASPIRTCYALAKTVAYHHDNPLRPKRPIVARAIASPWSSLCALLGLSLAPQCNVRRTLELLGDEADDALGPRLELASEAPRRIPVHLPPDLFAVAAAAYHIAPERLLGKSHGGDAARATALAFRLAQAEGYTKSSMIAAMLGRDRSCGSRGPTVDARSLRVARILLSPAALREAHRGGRDRARAPGVGVDRSAARPRGGERVERVRAPAARLRVPGRGARFRRDPEPRRATAQRSVAPAALLGGVSHRRPPARHLR